MQMTGEKAYKNNCSLVNWQRACDRSGSDLPPETDVGRMLVVANGKGLAVGKTHTSE